MTQRPCERTNERAKKVRAWNEMRRNKKNERSNKRYTIAHSHITIWINRGKQSLTTSVNDHSKIINNNNIERERENGKKAARIAHNIYRHRQQTTPSSTYKCGCDSTYFLVSFHLLFFFVCVPLSVEPFFGDFYGERKHFWPENASTRFTFIFIYLFLSGSCSIYRPNEWHWCEPAALCASFIYLDTCNILSDYSSFVISGAFVYFASNCRHSLAILPLSVLYAYHSWCALK